MTLREYLATMGRQRIRQRPIDRDLKIEKAYYSLNKDLYIGGDISGGYFVITNPSKVEDAINEVMEQYREYCEKKLKRYKNAAEYQKDKLRSCIDELCDYVHDIEAVPKDVSYDEWLDTKQKPTKAYGSVGAVLSKYLHYNNKAIIAENIISHRCPDILDLEIENVYDIEHYAAYSSETESGTAVILKMREWQLPNAMLYWDKRELLGIDEKENAGRRKAGEV